jgi:hypothetical protein
MPRPAKTPEQRANDVMFAMDAAQRTFNVALAAQSDPNVTADERRQLWAAVEEHGATIHRQSRILAGKSRGG